MASYWNATAATFLALAALLPCDRLARAAGLCAAPDARIVVDTSAHRLALCDRDKQAATFDVRIGSAGAGKTKEGDNKTPLGVYPLGAPRKSKQYGTFIPVGYPTPEQRRRGFTGGDIGVHGPYRLLRWAGSLVNAFDSTSGCVGIATDAEMDRIAAWINSTGARTIELR